MTSNYLKLKKIVEDKFGSMSNFSLQVYGSMQKLNSLNNLADNEENYLRIWSLIEKAKKTDYDHSKVYISQAEILQIIEKVNELCNERRCTVKKILGKFDYQKYYRIINGLNAYKNDSYKELVKILGL
jgi:hypothetical protein